jgi:hypothetical protein
MTLRSLFLRTRLKAAIRNDKDNIGCRNIDRFQRYRSLTAAPRPRAICRYKGTPI